MRVAIIGGGAAGLMCAATILETHASAEVFLIERNNELGKKVMISGGGRCNVTTGIHDVRIVLAKYPRGGKFLSRAMYRFPSDAVYAWFEEHGVPLKTQVDNRVFPQSDNGRDIVRAFERVFQNSRAHILLNTSCVQVEKNVDTFRLTFAKDREPLEVDALVLTTGGQAYRETGSTGDGYAFASSLGHTITPLAPSLSALYASEAWPKEVSGLSFANATIQAVIGGGPRLPAGRQAPRRVSAAGPFLFTHKGISGPAVFALSSLVAFEPFDAKQPLELRVDLFPDQNLDVIRAQIERSAIEGANKQFENILGSIVPHSLAGVMIRELGISDTKRANQVSKKEMAHCAEWLKGIPLHAVKRGAGDELVTAGGVELSEVDPATMESKVCPGLFFAGEILNVDAFTGGFNLQASWATGRLAGEHAAMKKHCHGDSAR